MKYDVQQVIVPLSIIKRNPYFFRATDEINANKNINVECVDCIHDTRDVELSNWIIITSITIPKLLSIPITPAKVMKAPIQTNHARYESSDLVHIISKTIEPLECFRYL